MTAAQFDALAQLTGMHSAARTTNAARAVLVDGMSRAAACATHQL